MGIYRGAGGSGDAVNDASSEALITVQAKDAALAAQAAAEAARDAAQLAETNAETAETNAETAETNAETAATNAAASASAASTSASNAASSASAASTSASNASTSASNAASSASAASTSASNAASSASTATTQATNASNSASAAATSATNASNSASAAATSATNAANSATAAQTAQTAAELAETNAETAEANAETAEANAAASASAAATSATNAANSASAAATSATNASNSASAAATSATNASNSASAAATSASNAATSESNAASSASAAAASYDSFDDRYLGAKSSAPTLDNDGNTLLVGALYYDTVASSMKVWSGSAWLDAYASLSGALLATNNLSDLNNTATARTNLGLGSIATQDANNVAVTGGSINGTTVGASTPSTGSFTTLSATGDVSIADKIVHSGDTDTAVRFPAADTVTVETSGAERLRIDSSGNVNISLTLSLAGATAPVTANNERITISNSYDGTIAGKFYSAPATNQKKMNFGWNLATYGSGGSGFMIGGTRGIYSDGAGGTYISSDGTTVFGVLSADGFTNTSPTWTERMRIDSSGNVIQGTTSWGYSGNNGYQIRAGSGNNAGLFLETASATIKTLLASDTNASLASLGTLTNHPLRFVTNDAERMRITSGGFVGIATSSPAQRLDVRGSNTTIRVGGDTNDIGTVEFFETTGSTVNASISSNREIAAAGGDLRFATKYFSGSLTERMRIDSSGNVSIGTSTAAGIFRAINSSGTQVLVGFGSTQNYYDANDHVFRTSNATSERMRIDSNGNVGIGTSSPGARLELGSGTDTSTLRFRSTFTSFGSVADISCVGTANETSHLTFATRNLGGAVTERMRITSDGNVGIGTSSPVLASSAYRGIEIYGNTNGSQIKLTNSTTGAGVGNGYDILVIQGGSDAYLWNRENAAQIFGTNDTERMRIEAGGSVLPGADAGQSLGSSSRRWLSVNAVTFTEGGASTNFITTSGTSTLFNSGSTWQQALFYTAGGERMRIDSSGRLLVNRSSSGGSVYDNCFVQVTGNISISRSDPELIIQNTGSAPRTWRVLGSSNAGSVAAFRIYDDSANADRLWIDTSGNLQFNSGYGSVATAYGCRAWVNFNGSGTVSIRASGNVSSITDNGTGDYTVNFTNAMPNTNYSVSGSCGRNGSGANANILSVADNTSAPTTSAVRVNTRGDNGTSTDIDLVSVMVYR